MTAAQRQLLRSLSARTPVLREVATWPGGLQLEMTAYLGDADLPDDLVVSVRCLVTVGARVLVCQDAAPSIHVLPGGRREPDESWQQTAQREVMEETGWHVEPASLKMLGFIHVRHVTPVPEDHPFPHPNFLQVVMRGGDRGASRLGRLRRLGRAVVASVDRGGAVAAAFRDHPDLPRADGPVADEAGSRRCAYRRCRSR